MIRPERGYPYRLKDVDIPLGAKIIAVADAFDAITTDSPYQKRMTFQEALVILKGGAGTKWDQGLRPTGKEGIVRSFQSSNERCAQKEILDSESPWTQRCSDSFCIYGPDGKTDVNNGMMKLWVDSGATCAELLILDSMTNNPIAAAKDDRKYGMKERFTKWGSVEDAFKYWAYRMSLYLDQTRAGQDSQNDH